MLDSTLRARSLRACLAAFAALAICLVVAAPRASADWNCGSDGRTFSACLSLDYAGYLWYNASASLHVTLPDQYAREIVACGADPRASIWGDDDGWEGDDPIRDMWPASVSVDATGLLATFTAQNLYYTALDEDDGTDEIYARFSYWDCHTGLTRTFRSDNIVGNWG